MTDNQFRPPGQPGEAPAQWPMQPQNTGQYPSPQFGAPQPLQHVPHSPYPGQLAAPQYLPPALRANVSGLHLALAWVFAVLTFAYMLPWAIAASRGKSNAGAVGLVNLFLGWTVIGWVVALVMSCAAEAVAFNGGTNVQVTQTVAFVPPPSYQPQPHVFPAVAVDHAAQITKLGEMHAAGVLTDTEFTAAKAKLLA